MQQRRKQKGKKGELANKNERGRACPGRTGHTARESEKGRGEKRRGEERREEKRRGEKRRCSIFALCTPSTGERLTFLVGCPKKGVVQYHYCRILSYYESIEVNNRTQRNTFGRRHGKALCFVEYTYRAVDNDVHVASLVSSRSQVVYIGKRCVLRSPTTGSSSTIYGIRFVSCELCGSLDIPLLQNCRLSTLP